MGKFTEAARSVIPADTQLLNLDVIEQRGFAAITITHILPYGGAATWVRRYKGLKFHTASHASIAHDVREGLGEVLKAKDDWTDPSTLSWLRG